MTPDPPDQQPAGERAAAAPGIQGYVLVVGPDGPHRDWIAEALRWGRLDTYACPERVLEDVDDLQPPVLAILDVEGTAEEGRASQARLLRHGALAGVPLLVLSWTPDVDAFSAAIAGGAAAYLVKPIGAEELVAVAKKLCDWSGTTDRSEKRRRLRRALLLRVDVDLRARKLRTPGHIVDASSGGCRIELGEPVAPGDLVRLVLHAHQGSTHVALGAEVRWYRQAPDGTHVAGVRFTGTTAVHAGPLLGFAARSQGED